MLRRHRLRDAALAALLIVLAIGTGAQVARNAAAGPHGHAPHLRPIAARVARAR